MIGRWLGGLRAIWHRLNPPPIRTTVRCTVEDTVGVSLRDGVHFIIDTPQDDFTQLDGESAQNVVSLRRSAAEALYALLINRYGAEPDEEIAATMEAQ